MNYSKGFSKPLLAFGLAMLALSSCINISDEVGNQINDLKSRTQSLDSLLNNEVDKMRTLDTLINSEMDKIKKLDSLIDKSASRLDSIAR